MSSYTAAQIEKGNKRLLRLADYVERRQRALKNKKLRYDQTKGMHNCGAPACLLGHARVLFPRHEGFELFSLFALERCIYMDRIKDDFVSLFAERGCDNAKRDWRKAVKFVRQFVADRRAKV